MIIDNYNKALKYLESFIGKVFYKIDPQFLKQHDPLERMRIFLSLLGNPQEKFKSVLIGGTSGKGSTSYLISHILITAGYKTGLTLSPHLQKVNERLQINGKQIYDKEFVKMVNLIIPTIDKMKKTKIGAPSYFEILIAMAFKYFMDQKIDIAVVEVGMGGEFDATNTLNPLITILTNVSLDHTNVLGRTVEKIARTKAKIIKIEDLRFKLNEERIDYKSLIINRKPPVVISGARQSSVIKIVADRCRTVGAQLNLLWRDFGYKIKKESASGINFDFISHEETLDSLKLSLLGQYQAENASLAIKTILELRQFGFKITDVAVRKSLKTAFFPGRFEVKELKIENCLPTEEGKLKIVLDGAHNPVKMKEFLKSLKKIFLKERKVFIVGFKFDKDIKKILKQVIKVADEIIITEFSGKTDTNMHASAPAGDLKSQISNFKFGGKIMVEKDSRIALKAGIKTIKQYDNPAILVVTGSLYLVGEMRSMV